jgi:hypothetical protein
MMTRQAFVLGKEKLVVYLIGRIINKKILMKLGRLRRGRGDRDETMRKINLIHFRGQGFGQSF